MYSAKVPIPVGGDDRNMGTMAFDALKKVKRSQLLNSTSQDSPDVKEMLSRGQKYYQDQQGRSPNDQTSTYDVVLNPR